MGWPQRRCLSPAAARTALESSLWHCLQCASMLFLVFSSEDRSLLPDGCAVTLPGLAHSVSGSWNTPPVDCVVAP